MADSSLELRRALARRSGTSEDDWFLTYRARHGMLVAFRELARLRGAGEVVTQLLTCCTAVDPIVEAGLAPRYADVSASSLALDASRLGLGPSSRAVVLQHSFGIFEPAGDLALREAADAAGALLVEDCAHCVGRLARDGEGRPLADVSVHSFGVEKMLPTHFGGAVYVSPRMADSGLRAALVEALGSLPPIDPVLEEAAKGYRSRIRVLNHLPAGPRRALRARWEARGSFDAAISPEEQRGHVSHEPCQPGEWIASRALEALEGLDAQEALRREAVTEYVRSLADTGVALPAAVCAGPAQPLLRLPVFLADSGRSEALLASVRAAGHYAVPWYRPLLFPGVEDPAAYGFDGGMEGLPVTERLSRGPVALPCDVTPEQARQLATLAAEAAR